MIRMTSVPFFGFDGLCHGCVFYRTDRLFFLWNGKFKTWLFDEPEGALKAVLLLPITANTAYIVSAASGTFSAQLSRV